MTADQIAEGIYRAQRRRDDERGKAYAWALCLIFFGPAVIFLTLTIAYSAADAVGLAKPCYEHEFVPAREYVWAWNDCADRPEAVAVRRVAEVGRILNESKDTTETTR